MASKKVSKVNKNNQIKIIVVIAIIILISLSGWFVMSHNKNNNATTSSSGTTTQQNSPNEAVKSVNQLYAYYLPLKSQKVAAVGNNPAVEPAIVQVIRASQIYFTSNFYNRILGDYSNQYRSNGSVSKDDITCVDNTTSAVSTKLISSSGNSAIVNANITLSDGTVKVIPVTVDLKTLKIANVNC